MAAKVDIQLAIDERSVEDPDLERLLDVRTAARDRLAQVRSEARKADDAARSRIEALDIEIDAAVRVGRYRITRKSVAARAVSFETSPSDRIVIALLED